MGGEEGERALEGEITRGRVEIVAGLAAEAVTGVIEIDRHVRIGGAHLVDFGERNASVVLAVVQNDGRFRRRIKQAVCGWGQAGKEQVAAVVATLVGLDRAGVLSDATDAAATAICHANAWFTNQGLYLPKPV